MGWKTIRLRHPERCVKQRQDAPLSRSFATIMDLPSSRELELEALLRKKDSQLADLTVCSLVWRLLSCSLITLSSGGAYVGRGQHPPPVSLDSA